MKASRIALLLPLLLVLVLPLSSAASDRASKATAQWWSQTDCRGSAETVPRADQSADPDARLAVGVQFHGLWADYTDGERAEVLDRLESAGVDSVRIDVSWAMLQPDGPDQFSSWGVDFVDEVLAMAQDRGLAPLVTLWLTPEWANSGRGERTLPDDPADYGRVAQWAADRWEGQVAAWEVWNEPNDEDFMRGADPAEYVRLLRAAYCGFSTGAPGTPVVFGGTSYVDTDWIARAYAAGAAGWFDVMGVHPYMGMADLPPDTPDDASGRTVAHLADLHELMAGHGDEDKPIWITEMGWSAHDNGSDTPDYARGVSESVQAEYLVRALEILQAEHPYVERFYWYSERDKKTGDAHQDGFGLLTRDLRPKPAYSALADYLAG